MRTFVCCQPSSTPLPSIEVQAVYTLACECCRNPLRAASGGRQLTPGQHSEWSRWWRAGLGGGGETDHTHLHCHTLQRFLEHSAAPTLQLALGPLEPMRPALHTSVLGAPCPRRLSVIGGARHGSKGGCTGHLGGPRHQLGDPRQGHTPTALQQQQLLLRCRHCCCCPPGSLHRPAGALARQSHRTQSPAACEGRARRLAWLLRSS